LTDHFQETERQTVTARAAENYVTTPSLLDDEVHVWLVNLEAHDQAVFRPLLANDEIERAERFHFERDRRRFIVARGWLRKLLGSYLGTEGSALNFHYAEKGKPSLAETQYDSLKFNLAHSHQFALFAFTRDREIGVDLEFMREEITDEDIARRFFSAAEVTALNALPADLRKVGFFNCWTRKEAYIKALGTGLFSLLDQFEVSLAPDEAPALICNHQHPEEIGRWSMMTPKVPEGYVGALVAEGGNWKIREFAP
jgi:4'-phosphopantetheinyl transferase